MRCCRTASKRREGVAKLGFNFPQTTSTCQCITMSLSTSAPSRLLISFSMFCLRNPKSFFSDADVIYTCSTPLSTYRRNVNLLTPAPTTSVHRYDARCCIIASRVSLSSITLSMSCFIDIGSVRFIARLFYGFEFSRIDVP